MTMRVDALALLTFSLLLVATPPFRAQDREAQERAVAEIKKAGGHVWADAQRPGTPVTRVDIGGLPVPSKELAHLVSAFPQLEEFSAA
jgi:hypothetical protein